MVEIVNVDIHCFKCGETNGKLVEHHISYEPEIKVPCCWSCHQTIHKRLRREKKCTVPAHNLRRKNGALYQKNYRQIINFSTKMLSNVQLLEKINYNNKTGNMTIDSWFMALHGKKLYYIKGD